MSEERKFKEIGIQEPGDDGEFRFVAIRGVNMIDTDEHGSAGLIHGFEISLRADVVENIVEIMDRVGHMIDDGLVDESSVSLAMRKGIIMEPLTAKGAAGFSEEAFDEAHIFPEVPKIYDDCRNLGGHIDFSRPEARITADGISFVSAANHDDSLIFRTSEIDTMDIRMHLEKIEGPSAPCA